MRRNSFFLALYILFSLSAIALPAFSAETPEPKAIVVTPPAPKFTDAARQAELARRRAEVARRIGGDGALIMFSAQPKIYTGDVDFMFRQENNYYYLTHLRQVGSRLAIVNDGSTVKEIIFLPKRNPQNETWNGHMYSVEEAQQISGIKTVLEASEFPAFSEAVKARHPFTSKDGKVSVDFSKKQLWLLAPNSGNDPDDSREFAQEIKFAGSLNATTTDPVRDALAIFYEMRQTKSPYELKMLQHAIDITSEAHMRAMAVVGRSRWEYEVQAEVEYTFRRRNADYWGYPSIVGCGPNATTLHYEESQSQVKPGDLLLMDVGAEYEHYTADVTRTFPVSGKFTKAQAEVYQIVYDAQEAAAAAAKPGVPLSTVSAAVDKVIRQGLARLGLITAPDGTYEADLRGQKIKVPQHRLWYMHGFGHWLGMNVHDVGSYGVPLKPGMTFTNEPGIYVRADALDYIADTPANREFLAKIKPAYEKYKNIGVRIEDDMLVTATGVEWMTKRLPRSIADIEAFMKKAPREIRASDLRQETNPTVAVFIPGFDGGMESYIAAAYPQGRTYRRP